MKEETSYTVYEAIDFAKNTMKASELAEYLWMNYADYADDLMEEIKARLYLSGMDRIEDSNENR